MDNSYVKFAEKRQKKPDVLRDCLRAFIGGGTVCCIGQALSVLYTALGVSEELAPTLVSLSLIFAAEILTALGLFYPIAKLALAGTLVPITGFANAVASPAIDARNEGYVMGVGAKIFTIAGPVILYGTAASAVYGVILYLVGVMK